jgi:hypothetical protein
MILEERIEILEKKAHIDGKKLSDIDKAYLKSHVPKYPEPERVELPVKKPVVKKKKARR